MKPTDNPLIKALHVPLGTRVEAVTRHRLGAFGQIITWRVWLGIKNKQVSPDRYEGTYLELMPDGSIVQNTTDQLEVEVMEKVS